MASDGGTSGGTGPRSRPRVYCLVPAELADQLHDSLRRHFRDDPTIEVVVEQRRQDRRGGLDRRRIEGEAPEPGERRRVRGSGGRRIAQRRSVAVALDEAPPLPRRARRHADRIAFVERLEPTSEENEDIDTRRLVTSFQAGDRAGLETLYTRYFDRVYAYLRTALRDQHEAEDVTQQVFVSLIEALPNYEPRRPFGAWLFRIVRNQAIDHLRKHGRLDVTDPAELARVREGGENGEPRESDLRSLGWISDRDLLLFVERLPLAQRQVVVMRFMLDLSGVQIAQILDRTPADVRRLQHRALRFLEARLDAIGRVPVRRERTRMLRRPQQARILRRRRTALLGG
jgi:RNA polymerase sigma-70 factor (ECF subfamily)